MLNGYQVNSLIGAGVGIRAVAVIIDGIILMLIAYVIAILFGTTTATGFKLEGGGFFVSAIIGFVYYVFFESKSGATPGKMLVGLKVVKKDGTPCDINAVVIRTVCRLIDGIFCYLVGAIFVWTSANNQRLGDRLADTVVIRLRG